MPIATIDPTTGITHREFPPLTPAQIEDRLARAAAAAATHCRTSFADRAAWMNRAADILDTDRDRVAAMMTLEMGKTLASARAEVSKCAAACRYYAQEAEAMLAPSVREPTAVGASRAAAHYQPLGVVLAVMPWNFPLWQAMRFAVPALMAGNVGLLKHASNVPQTALYMQDLFERAGFEPGVFQTLLIGAGQVESVLRDRRVAAATLTGSEQAGRAVAAIAGWELKKTVLELGGSDPFIVLPSADLARAAQVATTARCQNNGQSCIAAKRFIVHRAAYDEFADLFVKAMSALVMGDPHAESTQIGPLATAQGRADIEALVADAVELGATVLCGGQRPDGPGWFYPPTVLAGVTPEMRLFTEEAFGPVAALYGVDSLEEALSVANATPFGLGANAWTQDPVEQEACIGRLESGAVFINGMTTSYPQLPFGGIKSSGYGRELSEHGIREFCNVKTVWVA